MFHNFLSRFARELCGQATGSRNHHDQNCGYEHPPITTSKDRCGEQHQPESEPDDGEMVDE